MNNIILQWATDYAIPPHVLADLRVRMARDVMPDQTRTNASDPPRLESTVQARVRLEAARAGVTLMRNNVGAVKTETGMIRYGLANDSAQMNRHIKSSDLIGIRPVLIGPKHVGQTIGVFVARECKREGWNYTATDRERAQLKFIEIIQANGGDACFASGEGTI